MNKLPVLQGLVVGGVIVCVIVHEWQHPSDNPHAHQEQQGLDQFQGRAVIESAASANASWFEGIEGENLLG